MKLRYDGNYQEYLKQLTDYRPNPNYIPFSPGDIVDRMVILTIKLERVGYQESLVDECLSLGFNLENLIKKQTIYSVADLTTRINSLYNNLYEIGKEQWDWEDRVRAEQTAEAAVRARECNNRRVEEKGKINKLFQIEPERKVYATRSSDSN